MKNLKTLTTVFLWLGIISMSMAQSAEKTLVKSFNLQGADQISIELDGPVEVKSWAHKTIRVQMNISLKNRAESFLKGMITAGRYNLESSLDDDTLVITQPGMGRKVQLKSGELQENLSFIVFAPEHIHVEIENTASSANNTLKVDGTK